MVPHMEILSPCSPFLRPPSLRILRMASHAPMLGFRPSGWSPDPQADLLGPLAICQAHWMASQAFWLASIPSHWTPRPTGWPPDPPCSLPDPLTGLQDLLASLQTLWLATQDFLLLLDPPSRTPPVTIHVTATSFKNMHHHITSFHFLVK